MKADGVMIRFVREIFPNQYDYWVTEQLGFVPCTGVHSEPKCLDCGAQV